MSREFPVIKIVGEWILTVLGFELELNWTH